EASSDAYGRGWIPQARWTRAQSSKILIEAGLAYYGQSYEQLCKEGLPATALPSLNGSTGLLTGKCGYTIPPYGSTTKDYNAMGAVCFVNGFHAVEFGVAERCGGNSRTL